MSVRKRKGSPFYWYSFNVNGRRFRGSTGETEKSEAKKVEAQKVIEAQRSAPKTENWTLQLVCSTYWTEHAKGTASHDEIERIFADCQRILGKSLRTAELTSGKLIAYRATRRGEKRNGRYPQAHTINREFAYLRAAFEHCAEHHRQPLPDIKWGTLKAPEPPWRTRFLARADEAPALLDAVPHNVREIVICAIVTGLRKDTILRMDWKSVSLAERIITVIGKGGKENKVRIPPALMAILSTRKPEDRKGKVFDTTNFRKRWDAAVKAAKLENFRFHDLRHTFASWARKNGVDLPTLQKALHHSDVSMTMRYANVEPDEVETAFDGVSSTLLDTISGTTPAKTAEK